MSGSFSFNFAASLANFVITALLNFWFTPYLIHSLGVEAYGLLPLAMQITSYMGLATLALNAATARFVMRAIEQGDQPKALAIFNTAFLSTFAMVAALAVPASIMVWNIDRWLEIPDKLLADARWLFAATATAFLIGAFRGPIEVPLFCRNRLDIQSGISIVETAVKIASVVVLFSLVHHALRFVGVGIVLAAVSTCLLSIHSWRRLMPDLRFNWRSFDKTLVPVLISVGGWAAVNQVGTILFLAVDLIIANRLLGTKVGGELGALLVWPTLVRTMANYISTNFGPYFVQAHASGDANALAKLAINSLRIMAAAMGAPIAIVSALSGPLLVAWLGVEWLRLQSLMDLMVLSLSIAVPLTSLFGLMHATTNMRALGIVALITGVLNAVLGILLCQLPALGVWGIVIAGTAAMALKNVIFLPAYACRVVGSPMLSAALIMRAVLPGVAAGTGVWLAARAVMIWWVPRTWLEIFYSATLLLVIYVVCIARWALSSSERQWIGRRLRAGGRE